LIPFTLLPFESRVSCGVPRREAPNFLKMKTFNRLKHQIVAFENLLLAVKKASKGKRYKGSVTEF